MILQVNVNLNGESLSKETLQHVQQLLLMEASSTQTECTDLKAKASTVSTKEVAQQTGITKEADSESKQASIPKAEDAQAQDRLQPSLPDIQKAMMALANAKGNKEAKKLLEKYGATKVTALPEDLYINILDDVKQVMGNA